MKNLHSGLSDRAQRKGEEFYGKCVTRQHSLTHPSLPHNH